MQVRLDQRGRGGRRRRVDQPPGELGAGGRRQTQRTIIQVGAQVQAQWGGGLPHRHLAVAADPAQAGRQPERLRPLDPSRAAPHRSPGGEHDGSLAQLRVPPGRLERLRARDRRHFVVLAHLVPALSPRHPPGPDAPHARAPACDTACPDQVSPIPPARTRSHRYPTNRPPAGRGGRQPPAEPSRVRRGDPGSAAESPAEARTCGNGSHGGLFIRHPEEQQTADGSKRRLVALEGAPIVGVQDSPGLHVRDSSFDRRAKRIDGGVNSFCQGKSSPPGGLRKGVSMPVPR